MMAKYFFFNDTATTEIYTLSLHDALPIYGPAAQDSQGLAVEIREPSEGGGLSCSDAEALKSRQRTSDRKSTRLNSSHANISYAVFCLKKKKNIRLCHLCPLSLMIIL